MLLATGGRLSTLFGRSRLPKQPSDASVHRGRESNRIAAFTAPVQLVVARHSLMTFRVAPLSAESPGGWPR